MTDIFLLYPTNLFEINHLRLKKAKYYLIEDPIFFGYREKKMNFNVLKLVLHRASMKAYYDYLKSKKIDVTYVDFLKAKKQLKFISASDLKNADDIYCFDPVDHLLLKRNLSATKKLGFELQIHENPNFLTPLSDLHEYDKSVKGKNYRHNNFYEYQKKRMNLLVNVKSKDKENRSPPPKKLPIFPNLPANPDLQSKYVIEAKKYIQKHFAKNYGDVENFIYPITHQTSKKWFKHFLHHRFDNFGQYQDAMIKDEPFLYHSIITPMLNIGLLDPIWIIDTLKNEYQKKKIKLNNYEGYIRQLIGWREYSRFLYVISYDKIKTGNYFEHHGKLNSKWYTAKTGLLPIDNTIKMAFEYGYLHHILRLMMMSNFMNLCHLHPDQIYQWMMEFSCDSYDWVMTNNVYSMATFSDAGLTMSKPYLSSSNYILKMSNFKKDGHWEDVWNTLYYFFLSDKDKQLRKTIMARNLGIWKKKSTSEKQKITSDAKKYLDFLTN